MREKTCCFTGHRQIPPEQAEVLAKRLEQTLTELIGQGYRYFGTGGARGFDTLVAQSVLRQRARQPHIRLILVLPCKDQTRGWSEQERACYARILKDCDKVVVLSEQYTPTCMLERNRHLVEHSSVCVCYQTRSTGGTAYTVRYAIEQGLRLIRLADGG